ncbi:MAG: hypothetical protein PHQ19_04365 [Candidatus Krumholzibacteria bacterium]|nr:hypothetical protein [Candidatus Krumholzibacteria bacterium]
MSRRTGSLAVQRLQCRHCGAELPVMGRSIVFRCATCRRLWAASGERLRPVRVDRAVIELTDPPDYAPGDIIHLPFWVAEIDLPRFESDVSKIMKSLRAAQARLAEASLTPDDREPDPLTELGLNLIGIESPPSGSQRIVPGAAIALPPSAELDFFLRTMTETGILRVFVPAFDSPGEQVRLSIGRLMTHRRPELRTEPSDGAGRTAVPVIQAAEALVLARYVFFSTFPASMDSCAGLIDRLEVRYAAEPLLVELPFVPHGAEIESLVGGFHIPARTLGALIEETASG